MASTVYYRISQNDAYPEFGDLDTFGFGEGVDTYECLQSAYTHLIAQKLPDCLDWCGDELLIELDEDNNISAEDEAKLTDFDFGKIAEDAWYQLFEMSEEELKALVKSAMGR